MHPRNKYFQFLTYAAVAALALFTTGIARSQTVGTAPTRPDSQAPDQTPTPNPPTLEPEEFRSVLLRFAEITGRRLPTPNGLYNQIAALNSEELQVLHGIWPNQVQFAHIVDQMAVRMAFADEQVQLDNALAVADAIGTGGNDPVMAVIGVLPPCESFAPDYPSSGLLDFLESLGLADLEPDQRCSDDDIEIFATAKIAAEIAAIVAQAACDHITVILGEGTNAPFCVAAGIANGVKAAAQVVIDACEELTQQVDSAEIEGTFENTKTIIDALCCVPVSQGRKVQGCNGQDDDCDGTVNECDEDTFGPDVFVDPAIRGQCFQNAADAVEALRQSVEASDDCGSVVIEAMLDGAECDVNGSVTVTDDCGNATSLGDIGIRIDGEAPDVTCSVQVDTLSPPNHDYTDVGFSFTAVDNCSGDLTIEVKVTSDEQTTLPPGMGKASPFPDAVVQRLVDGTFVGVILRHERGGGGNGRVYNIHVFATDQCGNVGTAACAVSVPATGNSIAVDDGQYYDATGIN